VRKAPRLAKPPNARNDHVNATPNRVPAHFVARSPPGSPASKDKRRNRSSVQPTRHSITPSPRVETKLSYREPEGAGPNRGQKKGRCSSARITYAAFASLGSFEYLAAHPDQAVIFSASVYLAAAKLYGGAPKFLVLDEITSSFDAGHQYHLVEVIRTRFARCPRETSPSITACGIFH
jgi:hypothetical protein